MRLKSFKSSSNMVYDPATNQPIMGGSFQTDPLNTDHPGVYYELFFVDGNVWAFRRVTRQHDKVPGVYAVIFTPMGQCTPPVDQAAEKLAEFEQRWPKEDAAPKTEPAPPPPVMARPGPKAKTKPKARPTAPPPNPFEEPAS